LIRWPDISISTLEYKPLVNARAHSLGKRRQIVNAKELEQYHQFLEATYLPPAARPG